MKIAVLLLACLVLCHGVSVQEHLGRSQGCFEFMKGNGICDTACEGANNNYDNGDCCDRRGMVKDGLTCVAKTSS